MSDEKYFSQAKKKGELLEIKDDLNSDKKERKREGVKKIIAAMTIGKDVTFLFPDVLNCMQTDDLELKKLVYLYVLSHSKNCPDMAIMAINTFIKDCEHANPLIRALAIRTMGCMQPADKISDYICEPLRKCLKDKDPYVRKTAALGVLKLYVANASIAEEHEFLQSLGELLDDPNPMVLANAAAAISEITARFSGKRNISLPVLNYSSVNKLLTALGECVEWSQIYILEYVFHYTPTSEEEMKTICERIFPKLSYTNSAIVLSVIKIMLKYMQSADSEFTKSIAMKIAPPLITLLSTEPEIQFIALRNISIIVQKYPEILREEISVFFVKYNDPLYVKLEKLEIMIMLVSENTVTQVLSELNQYALEVDVDFVRKAVRAIGRCAIKLDIAAVKCVKTLQALIETKVNYVVQEAVVVMRDIFRKYPNEYESVISMLCDNLEGLDEPEARGAFIWIIGEYANRITNAWELLEDFVETFAEEQPKVQLQLLTAVVKAFLHRPTEGSESLQKVLSMATQETDNPDLRDRGYIYWRMLSKDPVLAKNIVLSDIKPPIKDETDVLEPTLLDELIGHIGKLASAYHKPPSFFLDAENAAISRSLSSTPDSKSTLSETFSLSPAPSVLVAKEDCLIDLGLTASGESLDSADGWNSPGVMGQQQLTNSYDADQLLDLGDSLLETSDTNTSSAEIPVPSSNSNVLCDLSSLTISDSTPGACTVLPPKIWLPASKGMGLEVSGTFTRNKGNVYMDLTLQNKALQAMTDFQIQFNKNTFGLAPAEPLRVRSPLIPNFLLNSSLQLCKGGNIVQMKPANLLQVAIKNNVGVFYFDCTIPIHVLFTEDGKVKKPIFPSAWYNIQAENQLFKQLHPFSMNKEEICQRLSSNNIFTVYSEKKNEDGEILYQTMKLENGTYIWARLYLLRLLQHAELTVTSPAVDILHSVVESYETILSITDGNSYRLSDGPRSELLLI